MLKRDVKRHSVLLFSGSLLVQLYDSNQMGKYEYHAFLESEHEQFNISRSITQKLRCDSEGRNTKKICIQTTRWAHFAKNMIEKGW